MDILFTVFVLLAVAYFVGWKDMIVPHLRGSGARSVKRSAAPPLPRYRSRGRTRENGENARERRQQASDGAANVRAIVPTASEIAPRPAPAAGDGAELVLSQNELQQLAVAIVARTNGATIEAAILAGFGARKGGGPRYTRARLIFDLAAGDPAGGPR